MQETRNKALDGIRGLAILAVIFFHILGITTDSGQIPVAGHFFEKSLALFFSEGWAGVDLFFVLSGFLITSILLKSRTQEKYFFNFYMRRALRIFPLYYLFLIVYFILLPMLFPEVARFQDLGARQWWYWTYTSNFEVFLKARWIPPAHCWSLAIEEQFYWLWPILVFVAPLRRLRWMTFVILLSQPLIRFLFIANGTRPEIIPAATFAHLDGLMAGGLVALFWANPVWRSSAARLSQWKKICLSLLVMGCVLRVILPFLPADYEAKRAVIGIFAWALIGAGLVGTSVALQDSSRLNRLLGSKVLVYLGTYSYGIYMVHHQIIEFAAWKFSLVHDSAWASWLRLFAVGMLITLPLTWLSFRFFEKPFLSLKHKFAGTP
jgi:peptidoglycan/LPS O-acetylase OafA/YrhL